MAGPDLYLIWMGTETQDPNLYGTVCSTDLPHFALIQAQWAWNSGAFTKPAAVALSDRILMAYNAAWPDNSSIRFNYCQSWPQWPHDANVPGTATSWATYLAQWGAGALMVWNGLGNDTRIWCSQYNLASNQWSAQYLTQLQGTRAPIQSGSVPAVINNHGTLLMVWRGEGDNDSLYYAVSNDGVTWRGNRQIAGAASTIGPALAIFNGRPVLAFKGSRNDTGIYTTTYYAETDSWNAVLQTGAFGTSHGPTLAVYRGQLFMAWKGIPGDTNIYYSTTADPLNPRAWAPQVGSNYIGTAVGPVAVVY